MWIKLFDILPAHNQICLVTARKPNGEYYVPQRAQYSEVTQMFHALDLTEGYPLYVTDWMQVIEVPTHHKKTFCPEIAN